MPRPFRRRPQSIDDALFIYCVTGVGGCELAGQLHTVRAGVPPVRRPACPHRGAHVANPWTIHWARRRREPPEYLGGFGGLRASAAVWVGEDLQFARLFNEVMQPSKTGLHS